MQRTVIRRSELVILIFLTVGVAGLFGQVTNGGFESNGGAGTNILASWTVVDQPGGTGSWYVQTGTASPLNAFAVAAPTEGTFAAMTDQPNPGSHILYQNIAVPATGGTLTFDIFIQTFAPFAIPSPETLDFTVSPNQHARVDIMTTASPVTDVGAGVLQNVFVTNPGDPLTSGYNTISVPLAPFAGQTVRLRFAEVDNQLYFNVGIDNVQLSAGTNQCPITQGFWKNHPDSWPVTSLTLGCQTYTEEELLTILHTPVGSGHGKGADASLILAHQLIAAKLSIANGADPAPIISTIADADALLCTLADRLPYQTKPSSPVGEQMVADASVLDQYNNGLLTPSCTQ